jgi:hypothetical protein
MKRILSALLIPALGLALASCERSEATAAKGLSASSATAPNPAMSAPDQTAWQLFVQATSPAAGTVAFQTWASDADTFSPNAAWPTGKEATNGLDLRPALIPNVAHRGPLAAVNPAGGKPATANRVGGAGGKAAQAATPAAAGAAPGPNGEPGSLPPAEEVRRNQAAFNYIVQNNLNKKSGLQAAFKKAMTINFPVDSIELKTNWLPLDQLQKFYPKAVASQIKLSDVFFIAPDANGKQHALIAMHVISKQVPNWTWATFEHQLNPGRCDFIGCRDTFGAQQAYVAPVTQGQANQGTTYANCTKTPAVQAMMKAAGVAAVFANYCLKGSQTDFIDNNGFAVRLANSVTEWGFVQQGSCMTCHGLANIQADGTATTGGGFDNAGNAHIGAIDPTFYWAIGGVQPGGGTSVPIVAQPNPGQPVPGMTRLAISADFVWSIPFCFYDDTVPNPVANPNCSSK